METLKLDRTLVNQILTQAQATPEREICGLIGGRDGHATTLYPITNVATDPRHRFRMEPREQIDAMRRMRDAGEALVAIYHSHPDAPAAPSATDIEEAGYPEAFHLIVSLDTEGVLQMAAFAIEGERAEAVALELE